MTPEEMDGAREMLAEIRMIAEEFSTVFFNHIFAVAPERRLKMLSHVIDGGETFMSQIVALVELVGREDELAAISSVLHETRISNDPIEQEHAFLFASFMWTAERCLGPVLTDKMRLGWSSLSRTSLRVALAQQAEPATLAFVPYTD